MGFGLHPGMVFSANGLAVAVLIASTLATPDGDGKMKPDTLAAFEAYVADVRGAFLVADHTGSTPATPGAIVKVSGGLVHHWTGAVEIPEVGLAHVLAVSQDYDRYAEVHTPVLQSELIERDGDRFRIRVRMKSDAGPLSAVLDVWSTVTYLATGRGMRVLSETRNVRQLDSEVQPAGPPPPVGRESGNFWAANTFTSFEPVAGGVRVELVTVGLSRRFPRLLGWLIEPFARRLGRSSAERTLEEFRAAVLRAHATDK